MQSKGLFYPAYFEVCDNTTTPGHTGTVSELSVVMIDGFWYGFLGSHVYQFYLMDNEKAWCSVSIISFPFPFLSVILSYKISV